MFITWVSHTHSIYVTHTYISYHVHIKCLATCTSNTYHVYITCIPNVGRMHVTCMSHAHQMYATCTSNKYHMCINAHAMHITCARQVWHMHAHQMYVMSTYNPMYETRHNIGIKRNKLPRLDSVSRMGQVIFLTRKPCPSSHPLISNINQAMLICSRVSVQVNTIPTTLVDLAIPYIYTANSSH